MSKKICVLSASPRKGGNSDLLCDMFIKGAIEAGHQAEKIRVQTKIIKGCLGCDVCKKNNGVCVHKDDMAEILEEMICADVIVLATPVYFYSMDGQLKTLIDRTYARYPEMAGKDFYFIISSMAPERHYVETTIAGLRGFVSCVPDAKEKGIVLGLGTGNAGDVMNTPAIQEAHEAGKSI